MHHKTFEATAQKGEDTSILVEWIVLHRPAVFGEEQEHAVTEDLRTSVWTQPLVIVRQDVTISRHQCQRTILMLGWSAVLAKRRRGTNELEEGEALLLGNHYRAKTVRRQEELAETHSSANLQRHGAEGQRKQGQMEGFHEI